VFTILFLFRIGIVSLLTGWFRTLPFSWAGSWLVMVPVPEVLVVLAVLVGFSGDKWTQARVGRVSVLLSGILALVLGLGFAFNWGEWFYRFFYRESVVLTQDLGLLPGMVNMLLEGSGGPGAIVSVATFLVVVVGVLGIGFLLLWLLSWKHEIAGPVRWILVSGLILSALGQYLFLPQDSPAILFVRSLAPAPALEVVDLPPPTDAVVVEVEEVEVPRAKALPDIHLFVVESYGHTLFSRDDYHQLMAPIYGAFEDDLFSQGWTGASGFLSSPAFGGRSWLADGTLLAGVRLRNQEAYDQYSQSGARNLSNDLGDRGYYRLLAAPGTQFSTPEWVSVYDFDRYMLEKDFEYRGPFITFGRMSDQFALSKAGIALGEATITQNQPQMAMYILANSHVPYETLPEYLPDWNLGDGSVYRQEGKLRQFRNNWLWGGEFPEGYIYSMDYELTTIRGYIERYVDPESLVIIVGDHQPRIPISERESTYSVPFHILSREPDVQKYAEEWGLQPRMVPGDEPEPHRGMEDFSSFLTDLLDSVYPQEPTVERE